MPATVKVLFVCVGNCVRSQMAEAIARHAAADIIAAESAGVHPLGFIDPTARSVLTQRGISTDGQFSKGLHNHALTSPDLIINMSGMPGRHLFRGQVFEDWPVPDPFGECVEEHCRIFDDIESRVKDLAERLRASRESDGGNDEAESSAG
ncbi:MAG TPA: low molecular weight phosphatase family protein [Candidatus Limnocylindrales bacterium]|nr:low molecular weight phosphatase family protein [Candidatus Limnocylindrales bacterium]